MSKRFWILLFLSTLILSLMAWYSLRTFTFFTSDTGLRFKQITALIEQDFSTFAIPYPTTIDPTFEHVPHAPGHMVIDHQLYFSITPYFTWLTAWFYRLFGVIGLMILPVGSTLITATTIGHLARLSELRHPEWPFLGTIFATPMLFYSLELWDHTFGVMCAIGGVYMAAKGWQRETSYPLFLGGLLLGFSTGQRVELYIFTIAVGLSLLLLSLFELGRGFNLRHALTPLLPTGGGLLLGLATTWGLQQWWYGHPLAPVMSHRLFGYGKVEYLYEGRKTGLIYEKGWLLTSIEGGQLLSVMATLLCMIGLVLIVFVLRNQKLQRPILLMGGFGLSLSGYLLFISQIGADDLIGLLPTFPLLPLSVIYLPQQGRAYRLSYAITMSYLGLMLLLWPTHGGQQWGARYLLALYPLLIYLAVATYQHYRASLPRPMQRPFQGGVISLMIVSVIIQLFGVRLLYTIHYQQVEPLSSFQTAAPHYIIANAASIGSYLAAAEGKQFLYIRQPEQLEPLLRRLEQEQVEQVVLYFSNPTAYPIPTEIDGVPFKAITPTIYQFVR